MKLNEIEDWTLRLLKRLSRGEQLEDSRIELKCQWPEPIKAARRIAGHANSAGGEKILWIIGVDEKNGVLGADQKELADWFPRVQAQFNGLPPSVIDLVVPYENKHVIALLFYSDRAPYVVKNPSFGSKGGGPVEYEVPWRESTSVRTARRSDLIRILTPIQRLPKVEVLSAFLEGMGRMDPVKRGFDTSQSKDFTWWLKLDIYFVPQSEFTAFPLHHCSVTVSALPALSSNDFSRIEVSPPPSYPLTHQSPSLVTCTNSELILEGPGKVKFFASHVQPLFGGNLQNEAAAVLRLRPTNCDHTVIINCKFIRTKDFFFNLEAYDIST